MTDDRDRFWDLSDLVPKKKTQPLPPFSHAVSFSDVGSPDADSQNRSAPTDRAALTFPELPEQRRESVSYVPERNRLLTKVTVTRILGGYRFYEEYLRDAHFFATISGGPCEYVPFYSSMPQYAHLDPAQKSYYLWFRETVKRKKRVRCDESYLRLLLFEIINLPDLIPPSDGVLLLVSIWRLYRERFPGLNMQLAGWIADYCLVHRLACPVSELRPIMDTVMNATDFREFYLGEAAEDPDGGLNALICALSDYSYATKKNSETKNASLFSEHISLSLCPVLKRLLAEDKATGDGTIKKSRRAFLGALCSYAVKYELTVEYRSFSGSLSLRRRVTAAVKYAENRLRALLSIRSRLAVSEIDEQSKSEIDAYFDRLSLTLKREKEISERPEYEARYDAEDRTISFSGADEIERESWENARLLVSEDEAPEPEPAPPPVASAPIEENGEGVGFSPEQKRYLAALLGNDRAAQNEALAQSGVSAEGMVEAINELASERFGDILIESTDDGFAVIEDYTEEVAKWTEPK